MSNPSYLKTSPFTQEIQQKELIFHLYINHFYDTNQASVANPRHANRFGETISNDWDIFDGLGPRANLVAHARGLNMATSKAGREGSWLISQNIVFVDARFKGSSLQWTGNLDGSVAFQGDGSIVGGTGEFEYAHGVVTIKMVQVVSNGRILNLQIRCRVPLKSTPPSKSALSGGKGGDAFDIPDQPRRLENVTIGSGDVIDSLAVSYTDQAGKKKTAGPWGGAGGLKNTIVVAPSETVKKIFGTTGNFGGDTVVTSLSIVTSVTIYGPFGKALGTTFSIPEKDNSNVVGFFARAGDFVDAIGVYASPN